MTIVAGAVAYPSIYAASIVISQLTLSGGSLTIVANLTAVASLDVSGVNGVANAGTIRLTGSGANSATLALSGSGGLANTGSVVGTGATRLDGGVGGITNSGVIAVNSGVMAVTGALTQTASGQIDVLGATTLTTDSALSNAGGTISLNAGTLIQTGPAGIANSGVITSSGNSSLSGGSAGVANTGVIDVTGGTLKVTGAIVDTGAAQINISSGAALTTNSALTHTSGVIALSGGALTATGAVGISNAGTITSSGTSQIDGGAPTFANSGTLAVTGGALTVLGSVALANSGAIALGGGALSDAKGIINTGTISGQGTLTAAVSNASGAILATGGALTVSGAITGGALDVGANAADNLIVLAPSTVAKVSFASASGAGTLTIKSSATLTDNQATPLAIGANAIVVNGTLSVAAGVTLAGGVIAGTGAVSNATSITGAGTVGVNVAGGTIAADGGTLTLTGLVDESGAPGALVVDSGATLDLTGMQAVGNPSAPTLQFTGATGAFRDASAAAGAVHLGVISGFSGSDRIVLKAFSAGDTYSLSGNNLTIASGASSQTFTFAAGTAASQLQVTDGGGLDTITICFMPGTAIRTPDGEAAVETLKPGDLVLTVNGQTRPIAWIGRQTVSKRFADPLRSYPIRVRAGALDHNVPARDLLISPDHALWIGGVMVNAGALVNGTSITRETTIPETFVYYHVELDDHALIFAEGAPAETFVDNVDRMNFDNWDEYLALYPQGKTVTELPYPRVKAHRQTPIRLRLALAARAHRVGAEDARVA